MGDTNRPIIRPNSKIQFLPENKKAPRNGTSPTGNETAATFFENPNALYDPAGTEGHVQSCPETPWNKKYNIALKTLIPFRSQSKDSHTLPIEKVGCWSYVTMSWYSRTMWKAFRTGLSRLDLFELEERDQAHCNAQRLQRMWEAELRRAEASQGPNKIEPSMNRAVLRFCATRIALAGAMLMVSIALQFLGPSLILKLILEYVNQPIEDLQYGWTLVLVLLVSQFFRAVTFGVNFVIGVHTAQRVLGALQYLAYSKLLRLAAPNEAALGQLMTFFTGDQERITEGVIVGTLFLGTPILFIMSASYATYLVGPLSLVGLLIILLFYPVMGIIATLTSKLRLRIVNVTDKRTTQMNEILNSIRLIKMYAWEKSFEDRVHKIRAHEIKELRKAAFLQSSFTSITPSVTIIATIVTFFTLTASGYDLTAPEAFTVFSIFVSLQFTVGTLPYALKCLAEAKVSLVRLQKFMSLPEYMHPSSRNFNPDDPKNLRIQIQNANLGWTKAPEWETEDEKKKSKVTNKKKKAEKGSKDEAEVLKPKYEELSYTPCLFDINLTVEEGSLIGVAGPIGAGKSSLLSAIMGEMKQLTGDFKIRGRMALVSQQAWIFNGTVRENILMGAVYEKERYQVVIRACALDTDLELLANGDLTEIGERGVNLSGGQKQRVNLARALYADMDIYLLDDPLSAVDARVAKKIFREYILTQLKARGKTVLLVSHGMQFLEKCDSVIYVSNGKIIERGTHKELMEQTEGQYLHMSTFDQSHKASRTRGYSESLEQPTLDEKVDDRKGSLTKRHASIVSGSADETDQAKGAFTVEEGDVENAGWGVLYRYFQACGGLFIMFLLFLAILAFALARLFTSVWLQIWLDNGDGLEQERMDNMTLYNMTYSDSEIKGFVTHNPDLWFYQTIYFVNLAIMVVIGLIKGIVLAFQFLKGSSKLHDAMLHRVMRSPMKFFDTTPSGRILNRFSKDMDELDVRMPFFTEFVCQSVLFCVTQISVVCFVYPYFMVPFGVILVVFCVLDVIMNRGILETKKLENVTKSPVIHHLSSAMAGITIIRGYQRQSVFQKRFDRDLNIHLSATSLYRYANRWFVFRMDIVGMLTIVLTAAFSVVFKGSVSPAIAGLALANVFQTCTFVPFVMRMKADFRARFNSVERVAEYATDLEQEAPEYIPEKKPASSWPEHGAITFKDVSLRYRQDLPLVLNKISMDIAGGEKVGIVGRTGAGKTSLVTTLMRLTEIEPNGSIVIDKVHIAEIGLHDLRSAIAVIPQDPVLFQGTLRSNVDPFDQYTDAQIWTALEKSHLKAKISGAQNQLAMTVDSEGDNFSVGEKQLICLTRALLRKNKVLLLDEATASVDVKTDFLIQATIKEAFSKCTVLTVAHRLHTVVNYDRIIVMKSGEIVEIGSPKELLSNRNGVFTSMMKSVQMDHQASPVREAEEELVRDDP